MSQELERVYTIPLGKVLLSPDNRRAKRAINMIKEFARHHMKVEDIRIEEDVSHQIWSRGIRSPPRKIRVRMTRTDEGFILVSPYDEEVESEAKAQEKEEPKVEEKAKDASKAREEAAEDAGALEPKAEAPKKEEEPKKKDAKEVLDEAASLKEKKDAPKKEAPKKEAPKKEAPKKEAPKKEAPKKEAPKKDAPKKSKDSKK